MLKIGEFARICRVSTQTLRYYDTEGVLQADRIDPQTGYRYYNPEKIKTFGEIKTLQQAGFSLEEIKLLLEGGDEARALLLAQKRTALMQEKDRISAALALVERLDHRQEILGEHSVLEVIIKNFEDDPCVIGRWELLGQIRSHTPDAWGPPKPPRDTAHPVLVCLPGGGMWWNVLWSKGTIYVCYPQPYTAVANEYRIHKIGDEVYMTLRWIGYSCLTQGSDAIFLLYRQTSDRAYSLRESQVRRDQVDFPYCPDNDLIGTWETVAYVNTPDDFSPEAPLELSALQYMTSLVFRERGLCYRHLRSRQGKDVPRLLEYTAARSDSFRGFIIDRQQESAEGYLIRELKGTPYLFVQHKSGDYFFGGLEPSYYVFKKADGDSPS